MKRGREDGGAGPGPSKRPASAAGGASAASSAKLTTSDALSYLKEVKERFKDQRLIYDTFLDIMKKFKAQDINTDGVIQRVKVLFKGHRELILGFNTFLPKGFEIDCPDEEEPKQAPKQPVEFDQAISYVNKIKNRFSKDERVYKAFLEILNMYRKGQKSISQVYDEVALLFQSHTDLLEEFTYFLPDSTAPANQRAAERAAAAKNKGTRGTKPGGRGSSVAQAAADAEAARRNINKRKSARRADELIRRQSGQDEDGAGPSESDKKAMKSATLAKELQFFERVKARLRNKDAYQEFLKCLNIFSQDIISKMELQGLVYDILGRFPDLLMGFNDLMARCESLDMEVDTNKLAREGKLSAKDISKMKALSAREKFLTRPISELDLSMCERCTTSYRLLPKGYPRAICSGRGELMNEVLNDSWVSVTSGSEDYSFNHMRKNQYEEALFRCEDDRFELELTVECNASAIRVMKPLVERLSRMTPDKKLAYKLEENTLSPIHLRCVEKIYGDHGIDVVELLKKNPAVAIPVVLARLQQKDEEWRKVQEDMNVVWREVYEKNFHKSLDHRSFYFKQMDKKALSTKAMLAEIKETADKRKAGDDGLLSVSSVMRQPSQPDLDFECGDPSVHEDMYVIIKYAAEEMLSGDQAARVMSFWRNYLEPFFGVTGRGADEMPPVLVMPKKEGQTKGSAKGGGSGAEGDDAKDGSDDGEGEEGEEGGKDGGSAGMDIDGEDKEGKDGDEDGDGKEAGLGAKASRRRGAARRRGRMSGEGGKRGGRSGAGRRGRARGGAVDVDADDDDDDDENTDDEDEENEGEEGREEGEEGEGEESEEDEEDKQYKRCKPLAAMAPPPAADAAEAPPPAGSMAQQAGRVIYGHDAFYLLFRFHHHLFNRLCSARTESAEVERKERAARGGGAAKDGEVDAELQGLVTDAATGESAKRPGAKPHATFMRLLFDLIDGTVDPSKYEDECRTLLGTNSYMLFTLDKLIYKVVKQLQTLLSDDLGTKLLSLFDYESRRGQTFMDSVYLANACVLLHEELCYRVSSDGKGKIMVVLMEPSTEKVDVPAGAMDVAFAGYLRGFLESNPQSSDDRHRVFLERNLKKWGAEGADMEATAMARLRVENGLECKISTATSKVSYVLDTEDLLHRKRGAGAVAAPKANGELKKPVKVFREWVESKQAVGAAAPEDKE